LAVAGLVTSLETGHSGAEKPLINWFIYRHLDAAVGIRSCLELTTFTRHQQQLSDDLHIAAENLLFSFSVWL